MAMVVKDNKLYIFVADSDAINTNRIKGSSNSSSITTNYCPPESGEQNQLFYEFLGPKELLNTKKIYLKSSKLREYKRKMTTRIKNKYAGIYNGDMSNFDTLCDELIGLGNVEISSNLYLTGDRPYLQFAESELWKKFKSILYGETSMMVLESTNDKFVIYPEFHPLFIKPSEINWNYNENDSNDDKNDYYSSNFFGIHMAFKHTGLEDSYIAIGWDLGDLSNYTTKELVKERYYDIKPVPDESINGMNQNIGQINRFLNETKNGDYVVYSNSSTGLIHIGLIEDYYYDNSSKENVDYRYINYRKVKWIKKNIDRNILSQQLKRTLGSTLSYFSINDYKSAIVDLINDNYVDMTLNDNLSSEVNFEIEGNGLNLIVYGTPGCGKSHYVENELLKEHPVLDDNTRERVIRTTFFQDYTNIDFIGQILPYIKDNGDVTYKFNPGPFALALKEALSSNGKKVALVIEELNRGNAPAIFGDVFQLLDRNEKGVSKYAITNVNLIDYLNKELSANLKNIKIPGNLYIYATMNTSDQNVFTLDTAFKRRWKFEKIKNVFKDDHKFASLYVPGMQLTWKEFVNAINNFMTSDQSIIGAEDKQIGVYFVDATGMRKEINNVSTDMEKNEFAYKIFEYLWDDVAKFDRKRWFKGEIKTLDELIDKYLERGINVFNEPVFGQELYIKGSQQKDSDSSEIE